MTTRFISTSAIGAEVALTLPYGSAPSPFEVYSVLVDWTAVAAPALARVVRISLEEPSGVIVAVTGGDGHPAGQRRYYQCFPLAPREAVENGDDLQWCPWPPVCVAPAGSIVRVKAVSPAGVTDDLIRLRIQYDKHSSSQNSD
jgi:hypothetical protein